MREDAPVRLTVVALLAMAMLAAGCDEDAPVFDSAAEMADALGCTDLETDEAKFVKEAGTCDLDGQRVSLFIFTDAEQRDEWLNFGERFSRDLITGPTWAVDPPEGKAEEVQEALL